MGGRTSVSHQDRVGLDLSLLFPKIFATVVSRQWTSGIEGLVSREWKQIQ